MSVVVLSSTSVSVWIEIEKVQKPLPFLDCVFLIITAYIPYESNMRNSQSR